MKTTLSRLISLVILFSLSAGVALNPAQQSQAAPGSIDAAPQSVWELEKVGELNGGFSTVAVQGSYAYVGDGDGLAILNVSNPASPVPLGRISSQFDYIFDVTVSGNYAYLASAFNALQVVDVSDPANPLVIGSCAMVGPAIDVVVSGSYAYVADNPGGLEVVDVSNPAEPVKIGSFETMNAMGVDVLGEYAFLATGDVGLIAVDISNPADPFEIGTWDLITRTNDVAVSGSYAYVVHDTAGLRVVDISDPANMVEVGFYDTPGYAMEVTVSGNYAYVADSAGGLRVIDITNPTNPVEVGSYETPDWALQADVSGNYAYIANELTGLWVVDISNPVQPVLAGSYITPAFPGDFEVLGNYAYVANGLGLLIMDVSNPAMPLVVGMVITPDGANQIAVSGNYAYMADMEGGLRVIDISNPANPIETGVYLPGDPVEVTNNVAISGSYAFVSVNKWDGTYGSLRVVDITDPSNPVQVGAYDTPSTPIGIVIVEPYAYVANYENGLLVLDISDPANPVLLGSCDTPGFAYNVAISGDFAFVADYYGIQAIDISDPANPIAAGYSGPSDNRSVVVEGDYAYVQTDSGLSVLDISNPIQPIGVAAYDPVGGSSGLGVFGSYIYIGGYLNIKVLRFTLPLEYIGFQPTWNGYSFANYGARDYGDYTFPDMQRMFGESAVCWMVGAGCEAKAQASLWNTQNYHTMNAGHSYGMAVSGLRFLKDIDTHPGVASVYDLDKLDDVLVNWDGESITTTLRRDIGFFTASQFAEPLRSIIHQALALTPTEVFTQVQASMMGDVPDPLIMFMVSEGKGHALTPYAITNSSTGVYEVWVYDSEHSGDPERAVIFDLTADTWSYDTGNGVWSGDASSHSLGVIPMSAHSQALECPWCASRLQSAATSHLLTLEGNGHLLVTDSQGRQLGYLGDQYVAEIPGGYGLAPLLGTEVTHEPVYTLPLTETYMILLNGQTVSQTSPASLWQFGAGYAASAQGLNVSPGTQDTFTIGGSGTLLGYHASLSQEPTLMLALDVLSATYGLDVQWIDIGAGEAITLTADTTDGRLILDGSQASGGMYNLLIRKASEAGGFPFYHGDIEILATDTHILHFGAWDGYGAITLEIDHGSDGTIDETIMLVNQVKWTMMPLLIK